MTLSAILDRTKPKHILIASLTLVMLDVVVNLLPASARTLDIFNSAFEVVLSVLAASLLLLMYWVARRQQFVFKRTLLLMGLTMVCWAVGDIIYLYLISIDVDPFISPSDLFYIAASLLMMISVLTIPGSLPRSRRRNMVFIEISILVLSAIVIFTILVLVPGVSNLNFDALTILMVFIYPVFDIILIWIIIILFFTYPLKNSQKVIGVLFAAATFTFFSDLLYLTNNIYGHMLDNFIVDLGYYFFYTLFLLSGFIGFKEIRESAEKSERKTGPFKRGNWIVFLPGVFLIVVIGLLMVFILNNSSAIFQGVVILIALVIILFIIHQYLVITDNIKLTREMQLINAQLESKVEERTAELSDANSDLLEEMKERVKAEEHLARSNQELALLNKDKDKLFTILAHDLRSPLGSMMKLSELLVENIKDFDEDELFEVVDTLNKSATQTFQLLNDLLAWSAVQMGKGERGKEVFAVQEVVKENVLIFNAEALRKQIRILVEINPAIVVFADKFAIQTVFRNLLSNAIKFTNQRGTIIIKAEQQTESVLLSVIDNGVGIPKEKQKRIFRVDAVSSSPGTDGEKGSGFGLLLCKDLIERNEGKIWLESEKGKGSTFYFTLPDSEKKKTVVTNQTPGNTFGKIDLKYDHARRLAFSTFSGEFNSNTLKKELMQTWGIPDYRPEYSLLIDLRHATFSIDVKDFQEILEIFSSMPGNQLNRKFALLTTTPQQVAYSTMFGQHARTKYPFSVEVFSTYEAALTWLGV